MFDVKNLKTLINTVYFEFDQNGQRKNSTLVEHMNSFNGSQTATFKINHLVGYIISSCIFHINHLELVIISRVVWENVLKVVKTRMNVNFK